MNRRMFLQRAGGGVLAAAAAPSCLRTLAAPEASPPKARLGMNLAGLTDWNTELPFVDAFRTSRPWISQRKGAGWGKGPELDLDDRGWVKRLAPDCWAETLMRTIKGGHYPGGKYLALYEGKGQIDFGGAGRLLESLPGRAVVQVDPAKGAVFLRIRQTDPADYIQNIRFLPPGFEIPQKTGPWHPAFLDRWRGMACLRFMDWMKTNGSRLARWADRPVPQDATFSRKGAPLELMIDLCNRLGAEPWFCMPHMADDNFVRRFAETARKLLDPKLRVWIEYSNEVWNSIFPQHRYAAEQGRKLGFAEKPWEAAWRYTAHRSLQIFRVWEEVFDGRERLARVLPSQAANPYVSKQILDFRDAWRGADALAIAPYISFNLSPRSRPTAEEAAGWSVDRVLDHVENVSLPQAIAWIREQKKPADRRGLLLVAYEAGQHLAAHGGAENNERLVRLLMEANKHPRMGRIYARYLKAWTEAGGDLLCHFSSVSRWSKWGCWGLLQFSDEPPENSPKFMAIMEWAKSRGQPVAS